FFLSVIPAWLSGGSFVELFGIYIRQAGEYPMITSYAPNIFQLITTAMFSPDKLSAAGIIVATLGILYASILAIRSRKQLTFDNLLLLSLYFVMIIPFFLPHMHERYFYPA